MAWHSAAGVGSSLEANDLVEWHSRAQNRMAQPERADPREIILDPAAVQYATAKVGSPLVPCCAQAALTCLAMVGWGPSRDRESRKQ